MNTLFGLREKISSMELEKAELLAEMEVLRENAEVKAESLEEEIEQL